MPAGNRRHRPFCHLSELTTSSSSTSTSVVCGCIIYEQQRRRQRMAIMASNSIVWSICFMVVTILFTMQIGLFWDVHHDESLFRFDILATEMYNNYNNNGLANKCHNNNDNDENTYMTSDTLYRNFSKQALDCWLLGRTTRSEKDNDSSICNEKVFDIPPTRLGLPAEKNNTQTPGGQKEDQSLLSSRLMTAGQTIPTTTPITSTSSSSKLSTITKNSNDSSSSYFWPAMGHGQWVEKMDAAYCRRQAYHNLYPCLMGRYQWEVNTVNNNKNDDDDSTRSQQQHKQQQQQQQQHTILPFVTNPCQLLRQHNITDIHAIGDSLIRQVVQGLIIVLNGKYDYAFPNNRSCWGDTAFSEYACRKEVYKEYKVCHDNNNDDDDADFEVTIRAIRFSYRHQHLLDIMYPGEGSGNTLYLYGVGWHPSDPIKEGGKYYTTEERQTIVSTSDYIRDKWKGMEEPYFYFGDDDQVRQGKSLNENNHNHLIWIPPHFKLSIVPKQYPGNHQALRYLYESSRFFMTQSRATLALNTFGMTMEAAKYFRPEKITTTTTTTEWRYLDAKTCRRTRETYDGSHFSRNINMIKAQMLLYQWNQTITK